MPATATRRSFRDHRRWGCAYPWESARRDPCLAENPLRQGTKLVLRCNNDGSLQPKNPRT